MSPKIPRLTPRKVISLLQKRDFVLDHTTGSHCIFFRSSDKRRVTVPLHTRDLAIGTLLSILKQAGIERKDLL